MEAEPLHRRQPGSCYQALCNAARSAWPARDRVQRSCTRWPRTRLRRAPYLRQRPAREPHVVNRPWTQDRGGCRAPILLRGGDHRWMRLRRSRRVAPLAQLKKVISYEVIRVKLHQNKAAGLGYFVSGCKVRFADTHSPSTGVRELSAPGAPQEASLL